MGFHGRVRRNVRGIKTKPQIKQHQTKKQKMTILQLIAEASQAIQVGDEKEFYKLQQRINDVILTSSDRQDVDSIMEVLETAMENI